MYPATGPSESMAHAGPMTRSVHDAAILLGAIAGPDERDRCSLPAADGSSYSAGLGQGVGGLKFGWSPDLGHIPVEPEVLAVAEQASRAFQQLGATLDVPRLDLPNPEPILDLIYGSIQVGNHGTRPPHELAEMDQDLVAYIEAHRHLSATDVGQAAMARARYWDAMRRVFNEYDLLVTPTLSVDAFEIGIVGPRAVAGQPVSHLAWTLCYPFNLTGQPAATVPCGFTRAGLPVGLQIIGPRFADALVLRAAAAFEMARPWADKQPVL
jgi:aspartyl-tRNA(Asn)/glutamyl-tRNA(Gln) amidotransferase subunit A